MTKSERKAQAVRDMKEGIRTGNYNLMVESGKTLYNYLSKAEKERASTFAEKGKIKEAYATSLADSLISKSNKKTVTAEDVKHASRNIDVVKSAELRSSELVVKTWRSKESDSYNKWVKASGIYKGGGPRKTTEIAAKIQYTGGTKKEGYTFERKVGNKVWEFRTPGYDERQHSLHGFQYRELGSPNWLS